MNLKELKMMIAGEYKRYMNEQAMPPAAGAPATPATPAISVDADDIDAGGDENPEDTLKDIYDMLKDYFEGGAADGAGADAGEDDVDDDEDMDDVDDAGDEDEDEDDEDGAEALQERFKKLANIIKG